MNKLLFVLPLGILLSGCSLLPQKSSQVETPPLEQQVVKEYQKVADAMASGKSVECVMTNTQEGTQFTYQVKGKKTRAFGLLSPTSSSSGNMLSDGEYTYIWSDNDQVGTKFKIPTNIESGETTQESSDSLPDLSSEAKQQEYENWGYTISCDEKLLSDDVFIAPISVEFSDLSKMMESATQLQAKMASSSGESSPELTQEQLEAMMKSFGGEE